MANVAMSDRTLDVVAALDMMIDMLDGPGTRDRLILFELAFCNSQQLVRGEPAFKHVCSAGSLILDATFSWLGHFAAHLPTARGRGDPQSIPPSGRVDHATVQVRQRTP